MRGEEGTGAAEKPAKVVLHRLAGTKKALDVCRLVERLYQAGKRVTVLLSDSGRAAMFDEYLWTYVAAPPSSRTPCGTVGATSRIRWS